MASAASNLKAGSGNDRFNQEAAAWDKNPLVHEASKQALKAILPQFPLLKKPPGPAGGLDVLEIGCGTGLLSCIMAPYTKRIVAVDAAQGMIDVLNDKVHNRPGTPQNIIPVSVLLEDPEDKQLPPADEENNPDGPRLKFDLITSHLVLHHIADVRAVLTTMLGCLKDGGSVALTDFEHTGPEARRFHAASRMEGVERDGTHPPTMQALMNEVGFVNTRVVRAWSMDKMVEKFEGEFGTEGRPSQPGQGEIQNFSFVLCMGERKYCQ